MFVKKNGIFRSSAGEISFRVRDRVTRVTLHDLRGGDCSGLVPDPNAGFACGSVVLFYPFSRNCGSESHNFVKKIGNLPPCRRRTVLPGQGPRNSCYITRLTR
jgi:hypothetical protein